MPLIIHVVAGLHPSGGGPSRTVVQIADYLARSGQVDIALLSTVRRGDLALQSSDPTVKRYLVQSRFGLGVRLAIELHRVLSANLRARVPAIIHNHGMWLAVNHWAATSARRNGVPLIWQPRGMLEPWAMSWKAKKKRLAMAMYQQNDLDAACVLVATATSEFENLRRLGFRQPIAVIPNGIELESVIAKNVSSRQYVDCRTALFLSRVHHKKGLLNLIAAWGSVKPQGWRLKIAGPDEGGHLADVFSLVRKLRIEGSVVYVGEVDDFARKALYAEADLFVLPTYSENFGVVVAEALAAGLPVITTKGAPWKDLETFGCGWWIDIGIEPLVAALNEATRIGDETRHAMGVRGRDYVKQYNWSGIAQQTIGMYLWVLGLGPKPECVFTD